MALNVPSAHLHAKSKVATLNGHDFPIIEARDHLRFLGASPAMEEEHRC